MTGQRPPWVIVILLPDDMPPVEAAHRGLGMPPGSRGVALCADAAEAALAALPPDVRPTWSTHTAPQDATLRNRP